MFVCVGSDANTVTTLDNMVLRRGQRRRYRNGQNACVAHLSAFTRSPPVRKAKSHEVRRQPFETGGHLQSKLPSLRAKRCAKVSRFFSCIKPWEKKNSLFHEGKKSCIKIHRRAWEGPVCLTTLRPSLRRGCWPVLQDKSSPGDGR